eukprot:15362323-Ditylum_brightwellii.AAC.1
MDGRFEMAVLLALNEVFLKEAGNVDGERTKETINSVIDICSFDAAWDLETDLDNENLVVDD